MEDLFPVEKSQGDSLIVMILTETARYNVWHIVGLSN